MLLWLTFFTLGICLAGCSSSDPPKPIDPSERNLRAIYWAYKQAEMKAERPPKSMAEIEPYFAESEDIASCLISPNDKQRYVIVWGTSAKIGPTTVGVTPANSPAKSVGSPNIPQFPIIAYEKTGSDGKRYVIDILGLVSHLSDDEFRLARFPSGHKPR
jgi:hypothetical protein